MAQAVIATDIADIKALSRNKIHPAIGETNHSIEDIRDSFHNICFNQPQQSSQSNSLSISRTHG